MSKKNHEIITELLATSNASSHFEDTNRDALLPVMCRGFEHGELLVQPACNTDHGNESSAWNRDHASSEHRGGPGVHSQIREKCLDAIWSSPHNLAPQGNSRAKHASLRSDNTCDKLIILGAIW